MEATNILYLLSKFLNKTPCLSPHLKTVNKTIFKEHTTNYYFDHFSI